MHIEPIDEKRKDLIMSLEMFWAENMTNDEIIIVFTGKYEDAIKILQKYKILNNE